MKIGRCKSKQLRPISVSFWDTVQDIYQLSLPHGTITRRSTIAEKVCVQPYRERKCAKNYNRPLNNTINLFLNCNQHFANFKSQQFPSAA